MSSKRLTFVLTAALIAPASLSAQRLDEVAPPRFAVATFFISPISGPPAGLAVEEPSWVGRHPKLVSLGATVVPVVAGVYMIGATSDRFSTGWTIANSVVLWSGPVLGPAAGYMAGEDRGRGLMGAALRTAVFAGAWLLAPSQDTNDGFLPNPEISFGGESSPDMGIWVVATGAILVSAAYDIVKAR